MRQTPQSQYGSIQPAGLSGEDGGTANLWVKPVQPEVIVIKSRGQSKQNLGAIPVAAGLIVKWYHKSPCIDKEKAKIFHLRPGAP
jgi:hypothetical protein